MVLARYPITTLVDQEVQAAVAAHLQISQELVLVVREHNLVKTREILRLQHNTETLAAVIRRVVAEQAQHHRASQAALEHYGPIQVVIMQVAADQQMPAVPHLAEAATGTLVQGTDLEVPVPTDLVAADKEDHKTLEAVMAELV